MPPTSLIAKAGSIIRGMFLLGTFLLAACQQDLHSNLKEADANRMLASLMASGISVEKVAKGKDGFTLVVESRDMLKAIGILNDAGLPKDARDSIGKVFQRSGIMSSPFEERVRYIFALGEEVANTLSQIDGVVTARVHIVLPDAPQLGQPVKPSSAAVFIKHQPNVDLAFFVPQIRRLVSSSIEGLEYTSVTVVLADAAPTKVVQGPRPDPAELVEVLPGLSIKDSSKDRFWQIAISVGVLCLILLVISAAAAITIWRTRRSATAAPDLAILAVEPS
jgi:type III secretion protein J